MKHISKILLLNLILFSYFSLADEIDSKNYKKDTNAFEAKIAVVDIESILEHSLAVADIKKSINNVSEKIQNELLQKELQLKKDEANIIEKRDAIPQIEFDKMVADFNQKVSSTQQEMQNKKSAMEKAHAAAIAQVHENTISVISELSKKHGFNIVFPSSQILFVNNSMNITHEVITNLNRQLQKVVINHDSTSK